MICNGYNGYNGFVLLRFRYGSEKMVLSKVMGVPQARWMVYFMENPSIKGIIFWGCSYVTSKWCYSGAIMVDIIMYYITTMHDHKLSYVL